MVVLQQWQLRDFTLERRFRGNGINGFGVFVFTSYFVIGGTCGSNFGSTLLDCGRFFGCGLGAIFLERLRNLWGQFSWSFITCIKLFCSCGKWEKWSGHCICSCIYFLFVPCCCFPLAFWVDGGVVVPRCWSSGVGCWCILLAIWSVLINLVIAFSQYVWPTPSKAKVYVTVEASFCLARFLFIAFLYILIWAFGSSGVFPCLEVSCVHLYGSLDCTILLIN